MARCPAAVVLDDGAGVLVDDHEARLYDLDRGVISGNGKTLFHLSGGHFTQIGRAGISAYVKRRFHIYLGKFRVAQDLLVRKCPHAREPCDWISTSKFDPGFLMVQRKALKAARSI